MRASHVEPFAQDVFDAVNLHGNIWGRKAGDLRNGIRIHAFEIGNDDLTVERLEPLDQGREAVQGFSVTGSEFAMFTAREDFERLDADQLFTISALPNHICGGDIVRYAIDPSAQGAAAIEAGEAAPKVEVNVLKQVAPGIGVAFISACETVKGRTVGFDSLFVKSIATKAAADFSIRD